METPQWMLTIFKQTFVPAMGDTNNNINNDNDESELIQFVFNENMLMRTDAIRIIMKPMLTETNFLIHFRISYVTRYECNTNCRRQCMQGV